MNAIVHARTLLPPRSRLVYNYHQVAQPLLDRTQKKRRIRTISRINVIGVRVAYNNHERRFLLLKQLLDNTKLDPDFCAALVGVPPQQFRDWINGVRPIPSFVIPELSTILGVPRSTITNPNVSLLTIQQQAGRIWFKLRDEKLTQADREVIGFVRKLGFYYNQLRSIEGKAAGRLDDLLQHLRAVVDPASSVADQGRVAALASREFLSLNTQLSGLGDAIRPALRRLGVLIIETPVKGSCVEGCAFGGDEIAPCIFVNSYRSNWYRRNAVLPHELCHILFDLQQQAVLIDFRDDQSGEAIHEVRADSFARHLLIPDAVLEHQAQRLGIRWKTLSAYDLAHLVAALDVEKRWILRVARELGKITVDEEMRLAELQIDEPLREMTDHALPTTEYFRKLARDTPKWIAQNRKTSVGQRTVRLPSGYIQRVIEAYNEGDNQRPTGRMPATRAAEW